MLNIACARLLQIEQCSTRLEARIRCSRVLVEHFNRVILAIFRSLPFSLSYIAFSKNTKTTLILARIGERCFQLAISLNINGQSIFLTLFCLFGAGIDTRCSKSIARCSNRYSYWCSSSARCSKRNARARSILEKLMLDPPLLCIIFW